MKALGWGKNEETCSLSRRHLLVNSFAQSKQCTWLFHVIFLCNICGGCIEMIIFKGASKWTLKIGTYNVLNLWNLIIPSKQVFFSMQPNRLIAFITWYLYHQEKVHLIEILKVIWSFKLPFKHHGFFWSPNSQNGSSS
jgi:hypothetical protein